MVIWRVHVHPYIDGFTQAYASLLCTKWDPDKGLSFSSFLVSKFDIFRSCGTFDDRKNILCLSLWLKDSGKK